MGVPIDKNRIRELHPNPTGTDGLAFLELSALDQAPLQELLVRLGFRQVGTHRVRKATLWRQGEIMIVLNADATTQGGAFSKLHGACISGLGFRLKKASVGIERVVAAGAQLYDGRVGPSLLAAPAFEGIGGSLLYLVEAANEDTLFRGAFASDQGADFPEVPGYGLISVDHLTHNVRAGQLDRWTEFYRAAFGFYDVFYMDVGGRKTGMRTRAMRSPCGKICIPVNEPTDPESQIQEYLDLYRGEGIQHVALLAIDLKKSMEALLEANIPVQPIPSSYYEQIAGRMPNHGEDLSRLRSNQILIDGSRDGPGEKWDLLLQVFSKNLIGPIFFEFIERRGNDGFGEGNAKALFEAIERDQIERGVVTEVVA